MEGKANFSRRVKQFDGLTWLTLTPVLYYIRSTPLQICSCPQILESIWCVIRIALSV